MCPIDSLTSVEVKKFVVANHDNSISTLKGFYKANVLSKGTLLARWNR